MGDSLSTYAPSRHRREGKAFRFDEASSTVWYFGFAAPGAATSEPVWEIRRFTLGLGGDITCEWADGDTEFDNVWDDRASLNYS